MKFLIVILLLPVVLPIKAWFAARQAYRRVKITALRKEIYGGR